MGFPQTLVLTGVLVGGAVSPSVPQPKGWLWPGGTGWEWGGGRWRCFVCFLCHVKVEALTLSLHLIVMMSDLVNGHGHQGDSELPWPMGRPFPRRGALQAIRLVVIMPALMAGAPGAQGQLGTTPLLAGAWSAWDVGVS